MPNRSKDRTFRDGSGLRQLVGTARQALIAGAEVAFEAATPAQHIHVRRATVSAWVVSRENTHERYQPEWRVAGQRYRFSLGDELVSLVRGA